MSNISLILGDITKISADAIVNAANTCLMGGGGVDGAIHRAGGAEILDDCRRIVAKQGGCNVGEAVITGAGKLPAKYVIHTVGPRWNGGTYGEAELLKFAYENCFRLIMANDIKTIAFPNISTGIYCFPKEQAAQIAVACIREFLVRHPAMEQIIIVCFEQDNYDIYEKLLQTA